jgi:hypothetical protein
MVAYWSPVIGSAAPGYGSVGVLRHWPGAVTPVNGGSGVLKPSVDRQVQIAVATSCPHAMPLSIDAPRSRDLMSVNDAA